MTPEVKKLLAFWKAERRQRIADARNQSPGPFKTKLEHQVESLGHGIWILENSDWLVMEARGGARGKIDSRARSSPSDRRASPARVRKRPRRSPG